MNNSFSNISFGRLDPAIKITFKFVVVGMMWILFSDSLLNMVDPDHALLQIANLHILKGMLFMGVLGVFLFQLIQNYQNSLTKTEFEKLELFAHNPNPMWIYDLKTLRFLDVNQSAINSYGYTREEFLKMSICDIRPKEDLDKLREEVSCIKEGHYESGIWRHVKKDGSNIYVRISGYRMLHNGSAASLVIAFDISDEEMAKDQLKKLNQELEQRIEQRTLELQNLNQELTFRSKQTEHINEELIALNEQLREANAKISQQASVIVQSKDEQFNRILESLSDVIWLYDMQREKFIYISRSAEHLYGESFQTLLHTPQLWLKFIHPEDLIKKENSNTTLFETGTSECTYRVVANNGVVRWIFERTKLLYNEEGKAIKMEGVAIDISYIKQTEEQLKLNKYNLDALINNTQDLIWSTDTNGALMTANNAFIKVINDKYGILLQPGMTIPKTEEHNSTWIKAYLRALRGEPVQIENYNINSEGIISYYEASVNPIFSEDGEILGVGCFLRDVTTRKLVEQKAQDMNQRYELLSIATNDVVLDWNLLDDSVHWNHGLETIFGYSKDEIENKSAWWENRIHPDDKIRVLRDLHKVFKHEESNWTSTYRFKCANESYKHVLDRGYVNYQGNVPARIIGSLQDISAQVEVEEALRVSNERYHLAARATEDVIWDWDLLTNTVYWSEGFYNKFGYSHRVGRVPGSDWTDHLHHEDIDRVLSSVNNAIHSQTDNKWEAEYRYEKADGSYAYVIDRGFVLRDDSGKPIRMIGAMQDITERMQSLHEIKKLSLVASKTDTIVIISDKDFCIEWVNSAFTKFSEYTVEEAYGRKVGELFDGPETDKAALDRIYKKLSQGESVMEEIANYSKSGTLFWSRVNANPIVNEKGEIEKFITIETIITEQKEYERNITAIARELSNLIENANTVIFGVDRNGYVNEWNKISSTITGFSKNEVYGKKIVEQLTNETDRILLLQFIHEVLKGQPISNLELSIYAKDKRKNIILLNATPRRNASGEIIGALIVGQDITELSEYRTALELKVKERTEELNESLKKERELVDMKSRFISIASHEFRTPLSSINFAAGFIRKYKNKIGIEELDKKLSAIEHQVKHMTYLLDDVLTIGKNESKSIQVQYDMVDVHQFFAKIVDELKSAYHNSHAIDITLDIPHQKIRADEKLFRNIFMNLLGNAIKFSPDQDRITVTGVIQDTSIIFEVTDFGMGIPAEDLKNIFEPFHRGNNVSDIQGTGLGLSIVKKAVDLLNSSLNVVSEINKGTKFIIKMPLRYE